MNYNKKSIEDIDVAGKRVLCRCDFNVPTKNGVITSDKRIVAALPTIQYLVAHKAKVILCSHMGKPKGEWKPELSLKVVADRISELLGKPVTMAAVEEIAASVLEDINPRDSWRASKALRQHIAVELTKRCLIRSIELAGGEL